MKKVLDPELSELLLKTVEAYNRYRSPEAAAKLEEEILNHFGLSREKAGEE